ncbi:MAG: hypothetical protein BZY82_04450 [SAR202 cluster bacterium Io17-Chloro-G3]|nr:MAG: hypothetical protein BZY82_04450 [SAR202 cluster bacterium Io17-Chloro-G3]
MDNRPRPYTINPPKNPSHLTQAFEDLGSYQEVGGIMATKRLRSFLFLTSLTLVLLALGACGSSEESAPAVSATAAPGTTSSSSGQASAKHGGILQLRAPRNMGKMDPVQSDTGADSVWMQRVYGVLIFIEADGSLTPQLAESWDLASDFSSLTFKLKEGIKFHDGTDFNAQSVQVHIQRMKDPSFKQELAKRLAPIGSTEILDSHTIKMNLTEKNVMIVPAFAIRSGMVPSPTAVSKVSLEEYNLNPVGAGPFSFKEWVSDSHVEYAKWGQSFDPMLPHLDGIKVNVIRDSSVALASFRAKELDILELSDSQVNLVADDANITLQKLPWKAMEYLALNPRHAPLDDLRVRQAVSLAIDQTALIEGVHRGNAAYNYGPCIWRVFGNLCNESYRQYEFDPDRAKALLKEAGFANGVDVGPVYWYSFGKPTPRLIAIQSMLKDVGIRLTLDPLEGRQATIKFQVKKEGAMYNSHTDCPDDIDLCIRSHFHSASPRYFAGGIASDWAGKPVNIDGFDPKALDKLIDDALRTSVDAERKKLYLEAQNMIVDNVLEVFIPHILGVTASHNYVKNFKKFPHGGADNEFETWLDK